MIAAAGDNAASSPGNGIARMVATDGTAAHRFPARLAERMPPPQDVADTLHQLAGLHARHPGVVGHALRGAAGDLAGPWLRTAAAAFADERGYLVRLAAAAGPAPSTPGHAAAEAAMSAQRHAVDLLAQSARPGCAIGTAAALVLDWPAIRLPLDRAALRLGIEPLESALPTAIETVRLIDLLARDAVPVRAMTFGVQQLLAQHRGLWDLLEARADARG
ncbi:DUF6975 family protein [Sphingomonas silueang]|uniref:DUF6975 family protein n=1 Tax=Sphingomonas silueang TaxID=3156617 RepID=UPI0032B4638B